MASDLEWFCKFLVHFSMIFRPSQVFDCKLFIEKNVNFSLVMPHNFVYTLFYIFIYERKNVKITKEEGIRLIVKRKDNLQTPSKMHQKLYVKRWDEDVAKYNLQRRT